MIIIVESIKFTYSRLHDLLIISDDENENTKDSFDNLSKQYKSFYLYF